MGLCFHRGVGKTRPHQLSSAKMSDEEVSTSSLQFKQTISAFSFYSPNPPTLRKPLCKLNDSEYPSILTKTHSSVIATRGSSKEKYNHLRFLQDYLEPNLNSIPSLVRQFWVTDQFYSRILWNQVSLSVWLPTRLLSNESPGQKSAEIGHHFGGPTNHFWPCLYESGVCSFYFWYSELHINSCRLDNRTFTTYTGLCTSKSIFNRPGML